MTLNERIGLEMRVERVRAKMTLDDVANKMGVKSKNTISRMELGKTEITVVQLREFCDAVGCNYIDILERVS